MLGGGLDRPVQCARERALVRADLLPQRIGDVRVPALADEGVGAIRADIHERLGIGNREAAQADRVDEVKDGGVGADAEGPRQDRDGGEDRASLEDAQSVPEIAERILEPQYKGTPGDPSASAPARTARRVGRPASFRSQHGVGIEPRRAPRGQRRGRARDHDKSSCAEHVVRRVRRCDAKGQPVRRPRDDQCQREANRGALDVYNRPGPMSREARTQQLAPGAQGGLS
jgi:hypothetical protein